MRSPFILMTLVQMNQWHVPHTCIMGYFAVIPSSPGEWRGANGLVGTYEQTHVNGSGTTIVLRCVTVVLLAGPSGVFKGGKINFLLPKQLPVRLRLLHPTRERRIKSFRLPCAG